MRIKTLACILLSAVVGTTLSAAQQLGVTPNSVGGARVGTRYGHLPLTFEANRGQSASQVKFLSRGKGYTAFLTTGGMVITLRTSRVVTSTDGNSAAPFRSRQTRRCSSVCWERARTLWS